MKKIILLFIIFCGGYLIYSHIKNINASNTQIDQISNGISQLFDQFKEEERISFMANSPEEVKIHFESQYIIAPMIIEKGFHDNKYLLYIEDFNHPSNEHLPVELIKEVKRVKDDRFNFILFEKK